MKNEKNMKGLQSIGEIMPAALKKVDSGRNFSKYTVIINWDKIVGKEIASNSFVSNIDRRTLIIKSKNSVWSHHLLMLKEEIIQKVNGYLEKNLIDDVRFMAGYDKDSKNYKNEETVSDESLMIPMRLDESEIAAAGMIAGNISDAKIKDKFIRLLLKDMALEKVKKVNKWKQCLNCDVLVPPEKKYCTVCQINKKERSIEKNKIKTIEKMLREAPWLSYNDIKKHIESSLEEYNSAKKILVGYYVKKIFDKDKSSGKIFQPDLVMLLKEVRPENLTQVCIDETIGEVQKRLFKKGEEKYVSASGS